jgi:hypothetical protein
VALDGLAVAALRLLGIAAGGAQRAAPAQEVPAAVELDLDRAQALLVDLQRVGVPAVALLAGAQIVLLGDQSLDARGDALVTHGLRIRRPVTVLGMENPSLIVQVPEGSSVEDALRRERPASVADGAVVVETLAPGPDGRLVPPDTGEVVLSVLAAEELRREGDALRRVVDEAGTGTEPLLVVVEAAEELRDEELAPVLDAARRSRRAVILRVEAGT